MWHPLQWLKPAQAELPAPLEPEPTEKRIRELMDLTRKEDPGLYFGGPPDRISYQLFLVAHRGKMAGGEAISPELQAEITQLFADCAYRAALANARAEIQRPLDRFKAAQEPLARIGALKGMTAVLRTRTDRLQTDIMAELGFNPWEEIAATAQKLHAELCARAGQSLQDFVEFEALLQHSGPYATLHGVIYDASLRPQDWEELKTKYHPGSMQTVELPAEPEQ